MDYCDECSYAKDGVCPLCQEEAICADCEVECLRCHLWPDDDRYNEEQDEDE